MVYTRRTPKVPVTCLACKKTFFLLPWEAKWRKFCSVECATKYGRPNIKGKTYNELYGAEKAQEIKTKIRTKLRGHHYGGKKRLPRVAFTCLQCGGVFFDIIGRKRKFCSHSCSYKALKGKGKAYRELEHTKAIEEHAKALKEQGFKVFLADRRPRPDIIAKKDGKVYAVEVEFGYPDFDKYKSIDFFDDIHWVTIKRKNN